MKPLYMKSNKNVATWLVALAVVCAPIVAVGQTAEDPREAEARAQYARGEYQQALAAFSQLYAGNPDPVYLRNIGRCHHKLRDAGRAIEAYRDYLRLATVDPEERTEVEGFIREMEQQQKPPPPPKPPVREERIIVPPRQDVERRSVTRQWWFWTGVGAVVLGAVATGIAVSAGGKPSRPACPAGDVCR